MKLMNKKRIVSNIVDKGFMSVVVRLFFAIFALLLCVNVNAQDYYESPYCPNSGKTAEEHSSLQSARKVNYLYAKVISDNPLFANTLDQYHELSCELLQQYGKNVEIPLTEPKLNQIADLKVVIKETINQHSR